MAAKLPRSSFQKLGLAAAGLKVRAGGPWLSEDPRDGAIGDGVTADDWPPSPQIAFTSLSHESVMRITGANLAMASNNCLTM